MQILDAMNQDSELPLNSVRVDGGMTDNKLMLQLQADILGIKMGEMNNVVCDWITVAFSKNLAPLIMGETGLQCCVGV